MAGGALFTPSRPSAGDGDGCTKGRSTTLPLPSAGRVGLTGSTGVGGVGISRTVTLGSKRMGAGQVMRDGTCALRLHLLDEALGREDHADALGDLAANPYSDVHVPTLQVLARRQRIRAMELRGLAAALVPPCASGERSPRR